MTSLRSRLLISYLAVVVICLAVVGLVLVVLLSLSPVPQQLTAQRLSTIADTLSTRLAQIENPNQAGRLANTMRQIARAQNVRIILLDDNGQSVLDSQGSNDPRPLANAQVTPEPDGATTGIFEDFEKREWLFAARPWMGTVPIDGSRVATLVVAERRPSSLAVLRQAVGDSLLVDLIVAGALGLVLSVVLALLMSEQVAGPLRRAAAAARSIARGRFEQSIPLTGPKEVQELAASFNEMTHQVQSSQQSQRDFVANVSHELKTPLTSIQGFSQAILEGAVADSQAVTHAAMVIHDEAERMRRLVDDLLSLARFDAGQASMHWSTSDLTSILNAAIQRFSLRAQQAGVNLVYHPQPLPPIQADGDRLAEVVNNLLDNALKFTPAGGRVTVTTTATPSTVQFSVADTGRGIPPEHLPRIFERFYQVDRSRRRSTGSGLGLAICREIVNAHGGQIRAESLPGQGTRFTVTLPTSHAAAAEMREIPVATYGPKV